MDKKFSDMLRRQAKWQRDRANLSWSEKLRMAVTMRKTAEALRKRREIRQKRAQLRPD
jgi:hypothetical protein